MTLRELRKERDRLRERFDALGGRGIEESDEIDEIEAEIEVRENPPNLAKSVEIVLRLANLYLDENGVPEDENLADTEIMRRKLIEAAMEKLRSRYGVKD